MNLCVYEAQKSHNVSSRCIEWKFLNFFKKIVDNLGKKEYSISNFKSTLKGDDWE